LLFSSDFGNVND